MCKTVVIQEDNIPTEILALRVCIYIGSSKARIEEMSA